MAFANCQNEITSREGLALVFNWHRARESSVTGFTLFYTWMSKFICVSNSLDWFLFLARSIPVTYTPCLFEINLYMVISSACKSAYFSLSCRFLSKIFSNFSSFELCNMYLVTFNFLVSWNAKSFAGYNKIFLHLICCRFWQWFL